jgi:predicted phage-related endonuclease
MFNEQQTAAAHAAKTQGLNMAKRNMLDYATQFAKNAWERNQFKKIYGLYDSQVKNEIAAKNILAGLNADGTPKTTNSVTTKQIKFFSPEFYEQWNRLTPAQKRAIYEGGSV